MKVGVSKSGWPAPRSMTSRPAARSSAARAETAIVADSSSRATFAEKAGATDMRGEEDADGVNRGCERPTERGPDGPAMFPGPRYHARHPPRHSRGVGHFDNERTRW